MLPVAAHARLSLTLTAWGFCAFLGHNQRVRI